MKLWKPLAVLVPLLMSVACSTTKPALDVRLTQLRSVKADDTKDLMLRGEQQQILYGAIGVNEQAQRRGQYYTVFWNDTSGSEPVEVVFEYHQASTGSTLRKQVQRFAGTETSGKAYFTFNGDNYIKGGRVLDYQCKLVRGGRELASSRSYLWR